MVRLEKGKLTRERIFYGNEGNTAKYNIALNKLKFVETDVNDNLTKMTIHILNPDMSKLEQYGFKRESEDLE